MQESIRMCRRFRARDQDQRLVSARGLPLPRALEEKRRALEESVQVQNECGLMTRMLSPAEARRIVPELSIDGVVAASFNPDDGVVFPWPFVWGYAEAARKAGRRDRDLHAT